MRYLCIILLFNNFTKNLKFLQTMASLRNYFHSFNKSSGQLPRGLFLDFCDIESHCFHALGQNLVEAGNGNAGAY